MIAQTSPDRCYTDKEYISAGVEVKQDLSDCDILLGIKEVPEKDLLEGKIYLFFSHTRKQQSYNQRMFRTILEKKITLIDYECLEHDDGQRILGFGFFAGVVGDTLGGLMTDKVLQRTGRLEIARSWMVSVCLLLTALSLLTGACATALCETVRG